jgi:hypothetical protein
MGDARIEAGGARQPLPEDVYGRKLSGVTDTSNPVEHHCVFFGTEDAADAAGDAPGLEKSPREARGVSAAERQALLALYEATHGDQWRHRVGWLGPAGTECSWHGVRCEPRFAGSTVMTGLDLYESNLVKTTTIVITHDMGVARRLADRVAVMYAGRVVEEGSARDVLSGTHPLKHPYTHGLLYAVPSAGDIREKRRLTVIEGDVPRRASPRRAAAGLAGALPEAARAATAVVERVLREFLRCGLLEHGFARLWCGECRHSVLVAFSCRGRSFCPSADARAPGRVRQEPCLVRQRLALGLARHDPGGESCAPSLPSRDSDHPHHRRSDLRQLPGSRHCVVPCRYEDQGRER